jgi:hypothetical protein
MPFKTDLTDHRWSIWNKMLLCSKKFEFNMLYKERLYIQISCNLIFFQASSISNVEFGAESIVDLPFPRKEQPKTRKRSRV